MNVLISVPAVSIAISWQGSDALNSTASTLGCLQAGHWVNSQKMQNLKHHKVLLTLFLEGGEGVCKKPLTFMFSLWSCLIRKVTKSKSKYNCNKLVHKCSFDFTHLWSKHLLALFSVSRDLYTWCYCYQLYLLWSHSFVS